jgi:hypothetical protein
VATDKTDKHSLLSLVDSERRYKAIMAIVVVVATFVIPVLRPSMPKLGVAGLQILGTVAGAYLGTLFQQDRTQMVISSHVRLSVRHLLDILNHLRSLVIMISEFKLRLRQESSGGDRRFALIRTEEWLDRIEDDARKMMVSVGSSTENWKDLSESAYLAEVNDYPIRDARLGVRNSDEVES